MVSCSCFIVSGICHGLLAGNHSITYEAGTCNGYGVADVSTGRGSSFHIFVEELRLDLVKTCLVLRGTAEQKLVQQ